MTILFVCADAAFERSAFRDERRGYWSAALPCALEKHGLTVRTAGIEALADRRTVVEHDVVLVARQPPSVWTAELADLLAGLAGGAIVEGPLARPVTTRLGVIDHGEAATDGALQVVNQALRELGAGYGAVPGGRLGTGTSRPVDLKPARQWPASTVPIEPAQADAWRSTGWEVRRWLVQEADAQVLADWIPNSDQEGRRAAIVQRDGLIGCSLGIFAFLGQSHTVEPFDGPVHRSWPRSDAVEALLLGLIDLLHARALATRVRLLPWPSGRSWSMHVRHDVDRRPRAKDLARTVARHREVGTHATWYWRARHLALRGGRPAARNAGNAALRTVAEAGGHEVALHTEGLWDTADEELAAVEAVLGSPVLGSSAHGDPECFRFQGAPNLLWAEQRGLRYTELISHAHLHPHRCALLGVDGTITLSGVLCLPHHASFDRSTRPGDTDPVAVATQAQQAISAGGLLQVLNHPDINLDALFSLLAGLSREGRWDATAGEAAGWWAATHVGGAIRLECDRQGRLGASSDHAVRDVQVESRAPSGELTVQTLSLAAGARTILR